MGEYDASETFYAESSNAHHVEHLRDDQSLMLIVGELDTNVPYNEATQLVAAMQALGKPVELLSFPDEGHEYRREHSRILQARTVVGFLRRSLAGAGD